MKYKTAHTHTHTTDPKRDTESHTEKDRKGFGRGVEGWEGVREKVSSQMGRLGRWTGAASQAITALAVSSLLLSQWGQGELFVCFVVWPLCLFCSKQLVCFFPRHWADRKPLWIFLKGTESASAHYYPFLSPN